MEGADTQELKNMLQNENEGYLIELQKQMLERYSKNSKKVDDSS